MTGTYEHSIDEKGRLVIPSRLRDELGPVFYLAPGVKSNLTVYPMEAWNVLRERASALTTTQAAAMDTFFAMDMQGNVEEIGILGDGIDLNGCRRVVVLHCDIETGDDAICLKNIDRTQPDRTRQEMRDIYVAHCRVASCCNGTKIGTETVGDVHHVTFRDIRVCRHSGITAQGAGEPPVDIRHTLAAISVQSNDGGAIHHITFADYRVEEVDAPLFLLHQRRERFRENPRGGALSHITVEGLQVEKAWRTSQILAQEGLEIGPVTLSGLQVRCFEEPKAQWDPRLPTGAEYPDVYNFGRFPAFGLYVRGCTGLSIAGADWEDVENSGRPAVDLGIETEET